MSQTVEHLEKVLSDLVGNRARLAEQITINQQQLDINKSQMEHFDTLIASTRVALGDAAVIAKIDELKLQPEPANEATGGHAPLGAAGAGAENAPAPAGADVSQGTGQG